MLDPYANLKFLGDTPQRPVRQRVARQPIGGTGAAALEPDSEAFFERLCGDWGLNAGDYRRNILARRQGACLRALGAACPADGLAVLRADAVRSERALGALMIGVTEFFRDAPAFRALESLLIGSKRPGRPLRVLSVGCSDGSELYSVAILLAQHDLLDGAQLHGLDARPAAVAEARAGMYPASAVAAVAPELRERHFLPLRATGRGFRRGAAPPPAVQVAESLRAACTWEVADAFSLADGAAGDYDLVLCRNVLIYLNHAAAVRLWGVCIDRVRPDGILMTGKAERPPEEARRRLAAHGPCIYRRRPVS